MYQVVAMSPLSQQLVRKYSKTLAEAKREAESLANTRHQSITVAKLVATLREETVAVWHPHKEVA